MTDSILNAINDANRTLDEWPETITDVTVEVPIVALRWLVHAASMHYTTTIAGHVNYCTVHHNIEDANDRCWDSFLPGDCVFTIAMIVLPEDTP